MAERLRVEYNLDETLIEKILGFWKNDQAEFIRRVGALKAELSKHQIYHELTKNRGTPKSHASQYKDTDELKNGAIGRIKACKKSRRRY